MRRLIQRLVDRPPKCVTKKLKSFPESGMDYTIVAVRTKDGRIFRQVVVGYDIIGYFASPFQDFDNPNAQLPFRLRDIIDIEWEGYRVGNSIKRPENFREEWKFAASNQDSERH